MRRFVKIIAGIIIALVVIIALALFALTQFVDPNDFKPQIRQVAHEQANLTLAIEGNLGWTFWPSLGVSIGKTEARIGDNKKLFAGIDQAEASVAVWPLLFGNVKLDGIKLDGLQLHLVQNKSGANWEQIGPIDKKAATPAATTTAPKADATPLEIPVTIPQVSISNAAISYDDNTSNTHINVSHINLDAKNVNLQSSAAFPVKLSLRYQDNSNRIDLSFTAQTSLDLANNHYRLAPMTLDAKIAGVVPKTVSVHLQQTVDANLDTGIVKLTDMALSAAGVKAGGHVNVAGLNDGKISLAGQLSIPPFDANKVLENIGHAPIKTSDPDALSQVSLNATFKGPAGSAMINPLVIKLDSSTLKGSAGLANIDTQQIVFDLALDKITLNNYLPPLDTAQKTTSAEAGGAATGGTSQVSKATTHPLSDAPLLPLDTLRSLNIDGKLAIGEAHFYTVSGKDLKVAVKANKGKLTATTNGQLLDGNFSVDSSLNAAGKQPQLAARGKIESLQIAPIVTLALGRKLLTGTVSTHFSGTAAGNTMQSLRNSADADFNLELKDATLKGTSLNDALAAGVNRLLGEYKGLLALLPKAQKLPRALHKDTEIVDLTANGKLKKQIVSLSQVKAQLNDGNINGHGWLNTNNRDFEFIFGMQSPKFSDSPYLKNTNWPIRCAGNLNGNTKRWCGPDRAGLKKIAKDALAKAASHKLAEKFGIDAKGDTTKEVLQNAAKKKVEQEKKEAVDKLKNKLGDKLNSLFH